MTLFLDTARIDHITHAMEHGIIRGITTNQKIFLKSGKKHKDFIRIIKQICDIAQVPVSIELTQTRLDSANLILEAQRLCKISEWVNIKVPMWGDGKGLFIISRLKAKKIEVNATCMMSAIQGVLAAEAGADYVSLFYNRINDYHGDSRSGLLEISKLRQYIDEHGLPSLVIAGSIRKPPDVLDCLLAGAHIVTVPYDILVRLPHHPRTESTIKEFDAAWEEFKRGVGPDKHI